MKFRDRLASQPPKEKQSEISLSFALRFNELLTNLIEVESGLESDLPAPIVIHEGQYGEHFPESTEFIQIEILADQIIGLIELHEDHR